MRSHQLLIGLLAGTYSIVEVQPDGFVDGGEKAGTTGGTVTNDRITGITLGAGVVSQQNDFDERDEDAVPTTTTGGGTLPFTGSSTLALVAGGAMLALLGLGLILFDRRRPVPAPVRDRRS